MIAACTAPTSGANLARNALASADCLIGNQVEGGYAALMAPGGSFSNALTFGLTIYVAIIGYRLILGRAGLNLSELVPHFIKIGIVLALATSWPSYQTLVFNSLFHGPEQMADGIVGTALGPGAQGGGTVDALQMLFDRLADYAEASWGQHVAPLAAATPVVPLVPDATLTPPASAPIGLPFGLGAPQFVAILTWISAAIMMVASIGVLLVVRIILALLLLLGPLFVALALFPLTRGLFEGWLRTTVKFALVPLFALPLTAAMVAVAGPFTAELDGSAIMSVRDGPVLIIVLVILVFAAVMWQAARLGGSIAGAIRLPRTPVVRAAPLATAPAQPTAYSVTSVPSRAEMLVQSIGSSGRGSYNADGSDSSGKILATRMIAVPAGPAPTPTDASNRLGQSYRRLAIGTRTSGRTQ